MGVYIKGMEMPSGCDDCYFCGEMGICSVLVATHINSGIVGEYRYNEFERPPFCPLIPIPPHGRLVDADAIETELWSVRRGYQFLDDTQTADKIMTGIFRAERLLKEAPVVIKAEG